MDLWQDWTTEQWQIVGVVAAIATAIATAAAVGFSWLWRLIDRQQAAWITFDEKSEWHGTTDRGPTQEPFAAFELANVGSGAALAVRVVGAGCWVQLQGEARSASWGVARSDVSLVPAMRSGDQVHVVVLSEASAWNDAEVVVTWRPTPSIRNRRRVERIKLTQLAPRPTYMVQTTGDDGYSKMIEGNEPEETGLPDGRKPQLPAHSRRFSLPRWRQTRALRRRLP
ncbi:hypothetical protein ASE01_19975 [Nocardioides sp. Root190]|uniref:hypothetical protein n=1 Tax=Nocardioides sp. Root190 TaxID=1736488 RepID=UPI0006F5D783|nr:hypothetical protein [Nocardioides sp. Root190]KRB73056.1 hypothetical protein ASE01_19975 [Nocardioides sp. Root190]